MRKLFFIAFAMLIGMFNTINAQEREEKFEKDEVFLDSIGSVSKNETTSKTFSKDRSEELEIDLDAEDEEFLNSKSIGKTCSFKICSSIKKIHILL